MWQYQNTDELYHYGILGMKWGHRRYQNPDGSYTNAGKRRYINDKTAKVTRDINSFKNANVRTMNGVRSKGRRESIERQMNAGLAGLKTYKKQLEDKYSKKWDKKVEKEKRKMAKKQSSNKKSKKMSTGKKIAIGAAVTAGILVGVYAHKKFKDHKAELNRDNKKYSEYKKKVREIINNKKALDDKWEKEIYNVYTHPNPLTGELRGESKARRHLRQMKSEHLDSALREIEDLNRKTFSDNRKDMKKEISNFMGEKNRKKAINNLSNIKDKASENVKILRKLRKRRK